MKKREEKKLREKIKQKQEIWNEEHINDLEWYFPDYEDEDDFCEICNSIVCPMIYSTGIPILCYGCEYNKEEN